MSPRTVRIEGGPFDAQKVLEKWAYRDNHNPEQNVRRDEALHETRMALAQEHADRLKLEEQNRELEADREAIRDANFGLARSLDKSAERIRLLEQCLSIAISGLDEYWMEEFSGEVEAMRGALSSSPAPAPQDEDEYNE